MPRGRVDQAEKPKEFRKTFSKMIKDFSNQWYLILFIIILAIGSAVLTVITPNLLRNILDTAANMFVIDQINLSISIKWDLFFSNFGLLLGLYAIAALLSWLSEFAAVSVSARYSYDMRVKIQNKLDSLPLSYFDRVPYGDTLSVGTNDVDNISRNLQSIITQIFSGVTLFFGSLIAMLVIDWRIALVAFVSLPLSFIFIIFISIFSGRLFTKYRKDLGELNGKIEETYAGYKIIKLFNKEQDVEDSFNETNVRMEKSDRFSQFLSGLIFPTTFFVNNLCYVGIAVVAGIVSSAGTMISFFMYLNLFTRPLQQIGQIANIIQSVVASGERIYALLEEKEEEKDPAEAINDETDIKGQFDFENVDFSYSPDKPLIENMNLHVNAGDMIAIVGPTGAGKTTLVNLIMRFYEINGGTIKLDNISTRDYTKNCLRGSIGMVLQDTWLFKGTIKENLLYGNQDASNEEIIQACKDAHIHHFIETLPGGYNYMLNEDGNNISQGQRQLLTIARAILSKPKILILDEATSSVDTRTEQLIQDALDNIMKGRTSFVIAHRLSTIKNAKTIIVMKKGHIVETGNHQELLAKNGFYADLYNSQFSGVNPMAKNENSVLES